MEKQNQSGHGTKKWYGQTEAVIQQVQTVMSTNLNILIKALIVSAVQQSFQMISKGNCVYWTNSILQF